MPELPLSNFTDIQRYIETPGLGYLNGINGTSPESLTRRAAEIARVRDHLPTPEVVISVGVGQGEELHAIHLLYGGAVRKIIGVDISQLALEAAKKRALNNHLPVEFILGSVTDLPLLDESVDGVVLSSLLHEVYSYSPDGKETWNKAVQESTRVTRKNGCILVRDSAAPNITGGIRIKPKTDLAREFYDYFRKEYRAFKGWDNLRGKFTSNIPALPILGTDNILTLTTGQAAEVLFHFVNFELGYPNDQEFIGNQRWKDLNEVYYIPNSYNPSEPMRTPEYVAEVIAQGNTALAGTEFELICAEMVYSVRPRMFKPLSEHFFLALPDSSEFSPHASDKLLKHFINKMELVFKKVRRGKLK